AHHLGPRAHRSGVARADRAGKLSHRTDRGRTHRGPMPLTVGTAGHIDHGKTWLVRALTGKDTDRLPEDQKRGISSDRAYAPLAVEEAGELVPGAEVVGVSAKMGQGLDDLRAALTRAADSLQHSVTREGATRLFVDRVFTLRGIGTVATGTLWSGRIAAGDRL